MSMSKKDFEAIAAAIEIQIAGADIRDQGKRSAARVAIEEIANDIANHCSRSNMSFDRPRFLKACGVMPSHDAKASAR